MEKAIEAEERSCTKGILKTHVIPRIGGTPERIKIRMAEGGREHIMHFRESPTLRGTATESLCAARLCHDQSDWINPTRASCTAVGSDGAQKKAENIGGSRPPHEKKGASNGTRKREPR